MRGCASAGRETNRAEEVRKDRLLAQMEMEGCGKFNVDASGKKDG